MAERFKAAVLKTADREVRGVRIPLPPPPSLANCGTAETGEIFRAVGGFCRVGVTRDALEGLKRPHFRFWSLISIFRVPRLRQIGERALVGGRAASEKRPPEGSQNQGQGYRGVAG